MHRFAFDNLISRPVRAILSILGLAVAIGGMVGLFSVAEGISKLVESTFSMVPGILVQSRGAPIPIFSTLPSDWQREIETIEGVSVVNPEVLVRVNVLEDKPIISPPRFLLGFDIPSRMRLKDSIYGGKMLEGRFLDERDIGTTNCLVSRQIADSAGRKLGEVIHANGSELTIVGVYEVGSMLIDCNLLLDLDVLRRISRFDLNSVSCYYVETKPGFKQKEIGKRIEKQFTGRKLKPPASMNANPVISLVSDLSRAMKSLGPAPTEKQATESTSAKPEAKSNSGGESKSTKVQETTAPPVEVRSADDWAEKFDEFTGDLKFFLTLITAVGLTIAVLSIINVMLMSVTERTIEFGILRANGWSRKNVMALVSYESAILGVVGGILGSGGGWVAVQLINRAFPEKAHLHAGPSLLCFSIAFSAALGMLGGLYPAWRAAKLSPMDAIRRG